MGVERTQGAGLVAGWSPVGACPAAERGPGNPIRLCNPHLTVTRRFGHIVPRRPGPRGVALVRSLIGPVTLLLALAVVAAGLYVAAVFLLVVVVGSTLRPSRFHAAGGDDGVRLAGSGRTRLRRPAGERPLRPLRVAGSEAMAWSEALASGSHGAWVLDQRRDCLDRRFDPVVTAETHELVAGHHGEDDGRAFDVQGEDRGVFALCPRRDRGEDRSVAVLLVVEVPVGEEAREAGPCTPEVDIGQTSRPRHDAQARALQACEMRQGTSSRLGPNPTDSGFDMRKRALARLMAG